MAEMWRRTRAVAANDALRVGARVTARGLRRATHLNGEKGTLTRMQGDRWGVIFDGKSEPKALLPKHLKTTQLCHFQPCHMPPTDTERAVAYLIYVGQSMTTMRPDVRARVELAWQFMRDGRVSSTKCVDSCVGNGNVNFAELYRLFDDENDRVKTFKEYFLSGLCARCQKRVFG